MKNLKLLQVKEIVQRLEKSYEFNDFIWNFLDEDELKENNTTEEIVDYFIGLNCDRYLTDTEAINYANAIKYLAENDQSLAESIDIAVNMGYEIHQINSELLASLLQSQNNMEDYEEFLTELEKELNEID